MNSLLARLARVMDLGSHLPSHCSSKVSGAGGLGTCASIAGGCGYATGDSVQESCTVTCGDVPATGVQGWQVARTGIGYLVFTHDYAQVLKKKREEEHEEQPSH
jgi:hypothetical protein